MNEKDNEFSNLSDEIFEFVNSLLENDYSPQAICIGLASHAARLGLQSDADATNVVGNLFLPIIHQLLDQSNYEGHSEGNDDVRITHECAVLQ